MHNKLKVGELSRKLEEETTQDAPLTDSSANNGEIVSAGNPASTGKESTFNDVYEDDSPELPTEDDSKKLPKKEPVLYTHAELENTVNKIAGGFYGAYISHYHPGQLEKGGKGIRTQAALEIIEFSKILLQELKKEG